MVIKIFLFPLHVVRANFYFLHIHTSDTHLSSTGSPLILVRPPCSLSLLYLLLSLSRKRDLPVVVCTGSNEYNSFLFPLSTG